MKKNYRIELRHKDGRRIVYDYFYTTLERIEDALKGNLEHNQVVLVFSKYGKTILKQFRG